MDDIVIRSRYQRQTQSNRRKSRRVYKGRCKDKKETTLIAKIARQFLFCVLLAGLVFVIKSIDTPATKYINEKIMFALNYNMDINKVFNHIQALVKGEDNGDEVEYLTKDQMGDVEESTQVKGVREGVSEEIPKESETIGNKLDAGVEVEDEAPTKEEPIYKNEEQPQQSSIVSIKDIRFIFPVAGFIGSPYGERVHPITNKTEFHYGIDIEAREGTPIKAACDGKVIEVGENDTYGKYVKLIHENNVVSIYAHCKSTSINIDDSVYQGDTIAKVGSTGSSTGPHLHFEIQVENNPVNPLDYIS